MTDPPITVPQQMIGVPRYSELMFVNIVFISMSPCLSFNYNPEKRHANLFFDHYQKKCQENANAHVGVTESGSMRKRTHLVAVVETAYGPEEEKKIYRYRKLDCG